MTTSDACTRGLHGFCKQTRSTCDCTGCHFGPCEKCLQDNLERTYKLADGRTACASCKRDEAHATPFKGTPCDDCGKLGAFRNPKHRRNEYFCLPCHQARGENIPITASQAGIMADCFHEDPTSDKHDWIHIRGARYNCSRCKQKTYMTGARR